MRDWNFTVFMQGYLKYETNIKLNILQVVMEIFYAILS